MMKVKNRPNQYVRRSDLPLRFEKVNRSLYPLVSKAEERNFEKAFIDSDFYFIFRHQHTTEDN
jgi:hypothetical protein